MKEKRTIIKKTTFNQEELKEIENAMKHDGFKTYNDYILHLVRNRGNSADAVQRKTQQYRYRYSELYTIYNKMRSGIDFADNIQKFMKEAGNLCLELM